jgi:hypothetical protein
LRSTSREPDGAYHWKDERFTRLALTKADDTLVILYQPMVSYYSDPVEYRQIICPILKDEWKVISTTTKVENATSGRLVNFVAVETISEEKRIRDVVAVEISNISKTKYWCMDNHANIKVVTVEMTVNKSEKVF